MTLLDVLLLLAGHLVLTGLPGVAACLLLASRRVTPVAILLGTALAVTGAVAMLGFWLYWAAPVVGRVFSVAVIVASVVITGWCLSSGRIGRDVLHQLATPLFLWIAGSFFVVFLGFVHGGAHHALATSAVRFAGRPLATDNDIPQFFTGWFYANGHSPRPPVYPGVWQFSDRPPLQVGYELLQRVMGTDSVGMNYEVVGVALQQSWIVGLWALLCAARVGRVTRGLAILSVLVSGVALTNGFFVWPKLLPAAMLIAAAAIVITPEWAGARHAPRAAILVAALLSLAMLGHGSSVFALIGLVIVMVIRGVPNWRWIGVAIATAAVFYAPWALYQRYGDPPGDRLTKWMLAGDIGPDTVSLGTALTRAYSRAGLGGTLHNKAENIVTAVGGDPAVRMFTLAGDRLGAGHVRQGAELVRLDIFTYPIVSLELLIVAPLLMLLARWRRKLSGDEWTFAVTGGLWAALGLLVASALLFGSPVARTILQSDSLALPIIAISAAAVGLRVAFPRLATYLIAANLVFNLVLYAPALDNAAGTRYLPFAILVATVSLIAFAGVSLRSDDHLREPGRSRRVLALRLAPWA